jgi:protein-tyrosine-phosphatase
MVTFLFVCTGNICRSPLADMFMTDRSQRLLNGAVRVQSAGIAAGRWVSPEALDTAREKGLDGSALRPTQVTPEMLRTADLVVTMTADHTAEVLDLAPDVADKTFTLKELVGLVSAVRKPEPSTERESILARIAELHRLRASRAAGNGPAQDVRDPLGLPMSVYREVAADIEAGVDELVRGLFGLPDGAEAASTGS